MSDSNKDGTVLLVDDEQASSEALKRSLERHGATYDIHLAFTSTQALDLIGQLRPHAVVVDLCLDPTLGPASGLEVISKLHQLDPSVRTLVLTGHGSREWGIKAIQTGAASFIEKPADPKHLLALLQDAVAFAELKRSYLSPKQNQTSLLAALGLESRSPNMTPVLEAAYYAANTKQPVLISGETGTGKGVLAQAIHRASTEQSAARPFVRFQPSFTGGDLTASELFGHQRGGFTGAFQDRKGLVEEAHLGTLFIDEIDSLPHDTQVLLLNVLQEKRFRRLGESRERESNFRLISASNCNIEQTLEKNVLRRDFFHRVAHFVINIPPLRQRQEDIHDLSFGFLQKYNNEHHAAINHISREAMAALSTYHWPGNVRELEAVVEGAFYRAKLDSRPIIETTDISFSSAITPQISGQGCFRQRVRNFELELIKETLKKHQNNQSSAAKSLGLERSTLRRILLRAEAL